MLQDIDLHVAALRAILGDKGLLVGTDMAAYEEGARFDKGCAAFVMRPTSTEETSLVVAYCVTHGIHIIPQSGNTGVVSASTADNSGRQAVLSLDRLSRKIELDKDNRTVRADAGFLLSQLNARLEPEGMFFPIDMGADPRLGGMLATNTGGARFLKYGDVRRNTLALTVVLADEKGSIVELGRPLRKNNTGADWKHLFIGTSGTFGIVTECVLNVERRPKQTATALLVPSHSFHIMPLLGIMEEKVGGYLSAFEGISGNALRAAMDHVPGLKNPFPSQAQPDYLILVELTRTWDEREGEIPLDSLLDLVLAEIWELADAPLADALIGPAHKLWALRHAIPEGVKQQGKLVACDLSFRRGDLIRFCDRIKRDVADRFPAVTICDFGHIGDGGVHFNLVAEKGSELAGDPEFEQRVRSWIYDIAVNEFGGSFSAEHGIGRKNQVFYDQFTPDLFKQWARSLKSSSSPAGLGSIHLD